MDCFICGQVMDCSKEDHHYKECGLDNVFLGNVEICRCQNCNEKVVSIPVVPQLNGVIGEDLLQKESILNGKEIRFLRKNMGLKAIELQKYLGVDNATISRWERGKQNISPSHDRLLRMVYAHIKGMSQDKIKSMVIDKFALIQSNELPSRLYRIDLKGFSTRPLPPS